MENKTKEQVLLAGATKLVEILEDPASALLIFTDALEYVHQYERKKEAVKVASDAHWALAMVIREVVIPWIDGGTQMLFMIGQGIKEIWVHMGLRGFQNYLAEYLFAGINEWEIASASDLQGVKALTALGETIREYEGLLKKEGKKAA